LASNFVTTTPWRTARLVCQSQAEETCDEEPRARGGELSTTQRTLPDQAGPGAKNERLIQLRFQEALSWRALRLTAKSPHQQLPKIPSARTPNFQTGRASDRPFDTFKGLCPGEAQRFSKSRNGGRPRTRKKQRRPHRQRRQQTSPADTSPSPRGAYCGAQERRGRLGSFLPLALIVSTICARIYRDLPGQSTGQVLH